MIGRIEVKKSMKKAQSEAQKLEAETILATQSLETLRGEISALNKKHAYLVQQLRATEEQLQHKQERVLSLEQTAKSAAISPNTESSTTRLSYVGFHHDEECDEDPFMKQDSDVQLIWGIGSDGEPTLRGLGAIDAAAQTPAEPQILPGFTDFLSDNTIDAFHKSPSITQKKHDGNGHGRDDSRTEEILFNCII